MSRVVLIVVALIAGCGGRPPPVGNLSASPTTLRIPHAPPRVGERRVLTIHVRDASSEFRKVKHSTVLAVEGLAETKLKVTYVEVDPGGEEANLPGKSFVVSFVNGKVEVVPADGTSAGDEAVVATDHSDLGTPDGVSEMFTSQDFVVGTQQTIPTGPPYPPDSVTKLTLRAFDATTASFYLETAVKTEELGTRMWGTYTIDRKTGRELAMSMNIEMTEDGTSKLVKVDSQTTIQNPR